MSLTESKHPESETMRFHPAGGVVTPEQWLALGQAAREHGDGYVYLEQHSVISVRGVSNEQALGDVPLPTAAAHVLASPLSLQARRVAQRVADALSEEEGTSPAITRAAVFGVDGGAGDLLAHGVAAGLQLSGGSAGQVEEADSARLIREGAATGPALGLCDAISQLVDYVDEVSAENPEAIDRLSSATPAGLAQSDVPIGWLTEHTAPGRVDLGAGLQDGVLPAEYAGLIAQLGAAITVTPWQGLVIHDLAEGDADVVLRVLAPRGFIFDANSPALGHR
ncbi:cobalamin biosynthesis protein [Corynebacterium sp. HMSC062E11]|uniref:cobalamin biosynthesis protein n=1 Tax=Corynebacterium TaxID=1716 RepID=UPI0008A27F5F|nr:MULTISPECIES: cobalamin biosynthesis protein [Corynebacterium]MDK6807301.1 cobalamin biosynthesis protein [Corynebacterium aurimucosum]MCZ9297856.1 cobalamin biosynthesis protein [Corynebacterium hesseae]NJJ83586.1 cobalamin biosynthesis protein [Corynebacterium aurimucosum]OFK25880.1 cobalamin biosynthesis protein [Corynebacterium sp. HMSC062E11]OFK63037.1 cobalamin biosynthesis protein [Corynebacterium sp. HMSC078A10]